MRPGFIIALVAILAAFIVGHQVGRRERAERPATLSIPAGSWPVEIVTVGDDGRPVRFRAACTGYVDGLEASMAFERAQ